MILQIGIGGIGQQGSHGINVTFIQQSAHSGCADGCVAGFFPGDFVQTDPAFRQQLRHDPVVPSKAELTAERLLRLAKAPETEEDI